MNEIFEDKDGLIDKKIQEITEMHNKSKENSLKRLKQIDEFKEICC